jgi:hypothetical protein
MSCLTASCASSPSEPVEPGRIVVEVEVPVFPPERYLEPCVGTPATRIDEVIAELSDLVDCERADKAALRAWIAERRGN